MARGWESKNIEAQQEEASRARPKMPRLTPEQRALEEKIRTLRLARARASDDLSRATATAHRRMLEETIAAVDAQIEELNGQSADR